MCDILNDFRYDGEKEGMDNIDDTIELLQNAISFKLPLLLKLIYGMKNTQNSILMCMQAGVFSNTVRGMTEMGIPRETACYLYKELFGEKECKEKSR